MRPHAVAMNHSLFSPVALGAVCAATLLMPLAQAAPYTKLDVWTGSGSTYYYPQSTTGASLSATSSKPNNSASASASLGSLSLAADSTGTSTDPGYAYARAEAIDTFTISGGTGTGTATFTHYLTGSFTGSPTSRRNDYSTSFGIAGTYSGSNFSGVLPPQTISSTISFTFGTPFDVGAWILTELSPGDGYNASTRLTLQSGGYSVTGATSYTGSSSTGVSKGSMFASGAVYDGFTLANTINRQSTASLLDGAASSDRNVSLSFLAPRSDLAAFSDIVDLKGTQNDLTVLQLAYDEAAVIAAFGSEALLILSWFDVDTQTWRNAVDGNSGGTATPKFGAYNPLTDFVRGNFGIDTSANTVWAVIDHNSEFAVTQAVPEPGSIGLLALGGLALLRRRKRARAAR